jgi:phytoene dehydrogenase-like protein
MNQISRRGFIKGAAVLAPLTLNPLGMAQQSGPSDRFDFVIAGAGHNSLICAAYLAKAGYKVLVLEGRPTIGGGCKTQEVCLPGFKEDLCSSVHSGFQSNPALHELRLREYGLEYLEPDPVMQIPFQDGTSITVWRDLDRTCESIGAFSKRDAQTFRQLVAEYKSNMGADSAQPSERREPGTSKPAGYWQRLSAMSGYDAACVLFESRQMRAASLACGHFGGVAGGDIGSGAQAFSLIVQVVSGRPIPKGGSGILSVSLGRFLEAHNAVVLTNKPVERLIIENGKCVGVQCVDGASYRAEKAVVSTIHVKHLVNMAPRDLWGQEFLRDLEIFQPEHAMFSFHFATSEAPKYGLPDGSTISANEAALMEHPESVLVLNSYNVRGELFLEDTPLQIVNPSVGDPSRAPAGFHTLKIEGTLPYALKEGPTHWDNIKDQVAETLVGRLRRVAPNLTKDKFLAQFLESPIDIERMNPAMWRGSAHHGDRRLPQFASYRMPIPGLYQTGACTPPGGSITGMPGRNAAAVILRDNDTSIEQVGKQEAEKL